MGGQTALNLAKALSEVGSVCVCVFGGGAACLMCWRLRRQLGGRAAGPGGVRRLPEHAADMVLNLWWVRRCVLQQGILDKYGVELIGAKLESINKAEDRDLFAQVCARGRSMEGAFPARARALTPGLAPTVWRAPPPPPLLPTTQAMEKLNLNMSMSQIATTMEECLSAAEYIGKFPMIIRPAFTLGGTGGGIAYNMDEFK